MITTIEHLDPEPRLPFDEEALLSGDPVQLTEELRKLVKTLQELLQGLTIISNHVVDLVGGEAIYSKLKLADGSYPLGTWRLIQVGDSWERQVQEVAGVWRYAGKFSLPIV